MFAAKLDSRPLFHLQVIPQHICQQRGHGVNFKEVVTDPSGIGIGTDHLDDILLKKTPACLACHKQMSGKDIVPIHSPEKLSFNALIDNYSKTCFEARNVADGARLF